VDKLISTKVAFCLEGLKAGILGDPATLRALEPYGKSVKGEKYIFGTITKRVTKKSTKSKSIYQV